RTHRGYPVIATNGRVSGVVTASDALKWSEVENPDASTIGDVQTRAPIVIAENESCRAAAERMAIDGIGRLPVVEDRASMKLVGFLTRSDLLKARTRSVEEEMLRERKIRRRRRSRAPVKKPAAK